jgi:hypothetical protein
MMWMVRTFPLVFVASLVPVGHVNGESLEYVFGESSRAASGFDFSSFERLSTKKVIRGGGLEVRHVGQETPLSTVGGKSRFGLRGDFGIELTFRVDQLEVPSSGDGSAVMLRLEYADREQSGLTVALNASPNELLFWQIDNTRLGQEQHQVDRRPAFTNIFESPQTIRLTRSGEKIAAVVGAAETMMEFRSPRATDADVSSVALWINTGSAPADMTLQLQRLRVEADQFANDVAAPSNVSFWTILFWAFVVLLAGAGAYWFKQQLQG